MDLEQPENIMNGGTSEDDIKIKEFREVNKNIKKTIMDKVTYSSQSINALKKVSQRLIQFYMLLKPVVYYDKSIEEIPIVEIQNLYYSTLTYPRSSYYQNQLIYYLKRDLIDFPFTIDDEQINTHGTFEQYSNPDIIDNNLSLTYRNG